MRNFRIAVASLKRKSEALNLLQKVAMSNRVKAAQGLLDPRERLRTVGAFTSVVRPLEGDKRLQGGEATGCHGPGVETKVTGTFEKLAQPVS